MGPTFLRALPAEPHLVGLRPPNLQAQTMPEAYGPQASPRPTAYMIKAMVWGPWASLGHITFELDFGS